MSHALLAVLLFLFSMTWAAAAPPPAPTGLQLAYYPTPTSLLMSFTGSSSAVSFVVERKGPSDTDFVAIPASTVAGGSGSQYTFTDSGLALDTTYVYRVRAQDSAGVNSDPSNTASGTTAPSAPTGLTATVPADQDNTVSLSWTNNSAKAADFYIFREGPGQTQYSFAGSLANSAAVGGTVSYADNGVVSASGYKYYVEAVDAANANSSPTGGPDASGSNIATATTHSSLASPAAPSGLTIYSGSDKTSLGLYWTDNSSNEDEFIIERQGPTDPGFTQIGTAPASAGTGSYNYYSDSPLALDTTYSYRVKARNGAGDSGYSNTASGTTAPTAPTGLTATAVAGVDNQITLTWTNTSVNATNFYIYRENPGSSYFYYVASTSGGGTTGAQPASAHSAQRGRGRSADSGANNTVTYTDSGLDANATYTYYVVAVSSSSSQSDPSNQASATTNAAVTVPNAPYGIYIGYPGTNSSFTAPTAYFYDESTNETGFVLQQSSEDAPTFQTVQTFPASFGTGTQLNYVPTGLAPDTEYSYQAYAQNSVGISALTSLGTLDTIPAAPSGLTATVSGTVDNTVNLSWTDNSRHENYFFIYREDPGSTTFTKIGQTYGVSGTGNTITYTDNTVGPSGTYTYQITAENFSGESSPSNQATAATHAITMVPAAPADYYGYATGTSISAVFFDESTNEDGFVVEQSSEDSPAFQQVGTFPAHPGTGTVLTYTGTGAVDTEYKLRAYASNSLGNSPDSGVEVVDTVPVAPSGLTATVPTTADNTVNLSWTDNSRHESSFNVYREDPGTTTFHYIGYASGVAGVGNTVTYTDITVGSGVTYQYYVVAANGAGESGATNTVSANTHAITLAPAAPYLYYAYPGGTTPQVDFIDESTNEDGFVIEQASEDAPAYVSVQTLPAYIGTGSNLYLRPTGLALDTQYTYRAKAHNSIGDSLYSSVGTIVTTPLAVTDLTATNVAGTDNQVQLSWTENSRHAGDFYVYRENPGSTSFFYVTTVNNTVGKGGTLTYTDTNLTAGSSYQYYVVAHNDAGQSAPSNTVTITAHALTLPPAAPDNLSATASNNTSVDVYFTDESNNEAGFVLQQSSEDAPTFQTVQTFPAQAGTGTQLHYTGTGLALDTLYNYQAYAQNSVGNSPMTPVVSTSTAPVAPSGLKQTGITQTEIDLSWTDNSRHETQFNVYRQSGTDAIFHYIGAAGAVAGTGNTVAYNDTGLTPGTAYSYYIVAINNAGGSPSSNTLTVTTVALMPPAAPSSLTATPSGTQIGLSWTDNSSNEDDFLLERRAEGEAGFSPLATPPAASGTGSTVTYNDSGLTADTEYSYQVKAHNGAGDSAYSSTAVADTVPVTPTGFKAAPVAGTFDQIALTWTDASRHETAFNVYREGPSETAFTKVGSAPGVTGVGSSVTFTDKGLTDVTAYSYYVVASNAAGDSAPTATVSAKTNANTTPPTTTITSGPAEGAVSCGPSAAFTYTGSDVATPTSALLYEYSLDGGAYTKPSLTTTASLSGLSAGQHTFVVKAMDHSGNVDPAGATRHFVVDLTPPVITGVSAAPRDIKTTVTWTTDKAATSQVEYGLNTNYGSATTVDANAVTAHSVTVTGLSASTTYHYRAHSTDGCFETVSPDATFTTLAPILPSFEVTSLTFPTPDKPGDTVPVTWTVQNMGQGDAPKTWSDSVYLSTSPTLDAGATLLGKFSANVALTSGASYTQTQSVVLPHLTAGGYYLIIKADGDDTIPVTADDNKTLAMPLELLRVQMLIATPDQTPLTLTAGASQTATLTLGNLSSAAITGITATVNGAAANIQVQVTPPTSLNAMASGTAQVIVTATDASILASTAVIHFTDAQGDASDATLNLTILPNKPVLTSAPGSLSAGMVRGAPGVPHQTFVTATVTNTGAATAHGLTVIVPVAPWLSLTTPSALGDLAPGASAQIALTLSPASTLPLGLYQGAITVSGTDASLSIPFAFTNVSDAKGDLKVTSSDEFTYFAGDHPPLAGASVTLTDPLTGTVVLTGTTDANGVFQQTGVMEGSYNMTVTAPGHQPYQGGVQVAAAQEADVSAFLSRDLVTYQWSVVPVDLQDHYTVTIQAVFQTHVPAPVVTISPKQIDVSTLTFDAHGQAVVDYTITNHGLIAADTVSFTFPTRSDYQFTPAMTDLGQLPALSTIVMPVTITKGGTGGMTMAAQGAHPLAGGGGGGDCSFAGSLIYSYICDTRVFKGDSTGVTTGGDCPGFVFGGGEPGGPGGSGGPITFIGGGSSGKGLCDLPPCDANTVMQVLDCLSNFLPLGCVGNIVNNARQCGGGIGTGTDQGNFTSGCLLGVASSIAGCAAKSVPGLGIAINIISCANGITPCNPFGKGKAKTAHAHKQAIGKASPLIFDQGTPTDQFFEQERANATAEAALLLVPYGDPKWLSGVKDDATIFAAFIAAYAQAIDPKGDGGYTITAAESATLRSLPLPRHLTQADVTELIARWNRTQDYYGRGIFNPADVPSGQSTDFIGVDDYKAKAAAAGAAQSADEANGFTDSFDALHHAEQAIVDDILAPAQDGTCATVKIQIDQHVAITRTAFKASLALTNAPTNVPLSGIKVLLKVTDKAGNDVTGLFVIGTPTLSGFAAIDGTGTLPVGTTGNATWTILPTRDAAPTTDTQYLVTGEVDYTQGGTNLTIPLYPTQITVKPDPFLHFRYFLQSDVYSDDPFTPQVEPAEPFPLGLLVVNNGGGTARDLTITSSQPQIVDNAKGLLINFALIGTQVNGGAVSPSLTVNLGDVAPNGTATAAFLLTSSLAGKFLSYSATFKNTDALGNSKTSLIDKVDIHPLEHIVRIVDPIDDGKPDFLANDIPNPPANLPDHVYSSDGTVTLVAARTDATVDGTPSDATPVIHLTEPNPPAGFLYIRVDDPAMGNYQLAKVVRSDGKVIRLGDNAWTTNREIHLAGQAPYQQYRLYLFDDNSTGSYTLYYEQNAPISAPVGGLKALGDGTQVQFGDNGSGGGTTGGTSGGTVGSGQAVPLVVTAVFPDALYVENIDRSAGIKIVPRAGAGSVSVGDLVQGGGVIRTDAHGERYIDATSITTIGVGHVDPLEIPTKPLYSGDFFYNSGTGAGQRGMLDGAGLNVIGLYTRSLGKVSGAGPDATSFTMTDGYNRTVTVEEPAGTAIPATGDFVGVTGIVSIQPTGAGPTPLLRLRTTDDLQTDLSSLQKTFNSPATLLSVGQNLFALPGLPSDPAPPSVLVGLGPTDGSSLIGRLSRYDAPTQSEVFWDAQGVSGPFGNFLIGEGYRLQVNAGDPQQINFGGLRTGFDDFWLSLPKLGATRIGDPFDFPVDWSQVQVDDGTRTLALPDAASSHLLSSKAQYGPSLTQTLGLPSDSPDSTMLTPWTGYSAASMQDNIALFVPALSGVPILNAISPSTARQGGPGFTLIVSGSHFASDASVNWDGQPLVTTILSPTRLTALVPTAALMMAGNIPVTVTNVAAGMTSNALPFIVTSGNPVPSISSLSPATIVAGSPDFALTVSGTGFLANSQVTFNGHAVTPTSASATAITFTVHSSDIPKAGVYPVIVANASPGGGSATASLLVSGPSLVTLAPTSSALHTATDPALPLTVNGSGFLSGTTVSFDGQTLTPTAVSSSSLTVSVPSSLLTTARTVTVFVTNPGGQVSNTRPFPVGTAKLTVTEKTTSLGNGTYRVDLTLTNSGATDALSVKIIRATLSSKAGTPVPQAVGTVPAGGTGTASLTFAGATQKSLTFTITYTGGSLSPFYPNP